MAEAGLVFANTAKTSPNAGSATHCVWGYASAVGRTSEATLRQQQAALIAAGAAEANVLCETRLEATPVLRGLVKRLSAGDTVIVETFTRLGPTLQASLDAFVRILDAGARLVCLRDGFDSAAPQWAQTSEFLRQLSFAGRKLVHQRAGAAPKGARPSIITPEVAAAIDLLTSQQPRPTMAAIARRVGISRSRLYQHLASKAAAPQSSKADQGASMTTVITPVIPAGRHWAIVNIGETYDPNATIGFDEPMQTYFFQSGIEDPETDDPKVWLGTSFGQFTRLEDLFAAMKACEVSVVEWEHEAVLPSDPQ